MDHEISFAGDLVLMLPETNTGSAYFYAQALPEEREAWI